MMARLGEIFTISSGGTPNKNEKSYYINGTIPWVKTGDLKDQYVLNGIECITEEGLNNSSAKLFPKDTVLVAMYGATIGACSILSYEASTNQACAAFLPCEDVIPEYLFYFLSGRKDQFIKDGVGGAQPNISAGYLKNVEFELVSLGEQQKVIDRLSKVDDLISFRKQQLSELDELVKARFVEMFGDPKHKKSDLVKIGEIGRLTSGGTPSRAKPEYFKGDIRWYSAGELNTLYLPDSIEHISETALQQSSAKLFKKNTLMIGMYDTAAFKMGILTEDSSSNQACANLDPKQGYSIVWLYYLFDIMKPVFLQERQGVRQKNLSLSKIKEFEVPFASFELQEQFADFVKQIDKSKFEIQQSLEKLETLKKSLMQQYFG